MQNKLIGMVIGVTVALFSLWMILQNRKDAREFDQAACHGAQLKTTAAREEAMSAGRYINQRYDCIDKASYLAGLEYSKKQDAKYQREADEKIKREADAKLEEAQGFAFARSKFQTTVAVTGTDSPPLPSPPANLFVRTSYKSGQNTLPAFISPDTKTKQKHPAIIWITGGDSNSLSDFWTPGNDNDDQSARAFREAGIVMMFPVLRGGNGNAAGKEYFYGEVDDIIAAADHLAAQPHVDPAQIYLGGHSTGGTLVLLAAEASNRFARVFAFGPVASVSSYGSNLVPVKFRDLDAKELRLRSPIHWLNSITKPTYIIEGTQGSGNIEDLNKICKQSTNPLLQCIPAEGYDHYSVLPAVSRVIAARLAVAATGFEFALKPDEFKKK
jgi:acetyl esterase/lipase